MNHDKHQQSGKKGSEFLYIKNMVCDRCIRVVSDELRAMGIDILRIELGEVEVKKSITSEERKKIRQMLETNGFELIEDKNAKVIEAVKTAIIQLVHHNHADEPMKWKISEYLSRKVNRDYHSISQLFSSVENVTIEHYLIKQKIERVKELLKYDDMSLSQIAVMMDYSSVQHLSNQFKKVTGMTPSAFKSLSPSHSSRKRTALDKIH